MICFLLDYLPIVILHHLFTYFLPEDILSSLFNVSLYLNDAIRSYSNYRLNFKSIHRSDFDLICQHILPSQVKSLILSDDNDTPGQSELFLSRFQIDQFINLQFLSLIQIEKKSLEAITTQLNKLNNLRSLLLNSEIIIPLSLPLANLRYLELSQYSLDQLKNICSTTPRLKTLKVTIVHKESNFEFQCQLNYLTRLIVHIDGFYVSTDEIAKFLINFPCLRHLELHTGCFANLADGRQWELLAKHLVTFKFMFKVALHSIEITLDTFRTSFWLEEKRLFVAYDGKYLYTIPLIPCSIYQHVNESFQLPQYTTILKSSVFYDHVIKLTVEFDLIATYHRFMNIKTLEIGQKYISIEMLSAIVNLKGVTSLTLPSTMSKSKIKYLVDNMPHLQFLSIDTLMSKEAYIYFQESGRNFSDFLETFKDLQFEQIRELTISQYHIIDNSYIIDKLCRLFPNIERLHISIGRLDNIIQLINNLEYLSSVSFTLKFLSNNEKEYFILKPESIISTCTYKLDDSCLHVWVQKGAKEITPKKREYVWNRFNYMLSQRSFLSIIISFILLNHLFNIILCIWTYLFTDALIKRTIFFQIFSPSKIQSISQLCPIRFKKYNQISVYLFGYAFVWIFSIIACIYSDRWQLIFVNKFSGKINYYDNHLSLLFIHPMGYILTGIGFMACLIGEHKMHRVHQWINDLILYCIIGLCICIITIIL